MAYKFMMFVDDSQNVTVLLSEVLDVPHFLSSHLSISLINS